MEIPPEWFWCTISLWMMKNKSTSHHTADLILNRFETHSLVKVFVLCQGPQGISSTTQIFDKRFQFKPPFNSKDFFERGK